MNFNCHLNKILNCIILPVSERIKILIIFITLIFCLSSSTIKAQVLTDTASLDLIKRGVDYIYNFQFDKAENVCNTISQSYTGHPITNLLRGMITFWKNYPLIPSSPAHVSFEKDMRRGIELSEKKHNPEYEAEYLLTDLCARGLLLNYYANNNLNAEIIPLAKETYQDIRRAFDFTGVYSDFYFFTGLYNYYREAYPEAHRLYRTLAFLFPKGNKEKGCKDLQIAANNSIFLKAESSSVLSWINLSFENNYREAFNYSKSLQDLYPTNPECLGEYIKNLLLVKEYEKAESLIISSVNDINNPYYQAQLSIFNGILQEKKYHDNEKAQQYYNKGIRDISIFGEYGNEFAAYAYFGLSRTSVDKSDKHNKRIYRKKANELAVSKRVNFDD